MGILATSDRRSATGVVATTDSRMEIPAARRLTISRDTNQLRLSLATSLVATSLVAAVGGAQSQWELLKAETTASFRGLSVVDDRIIWASGTRGTVIHSTDGGATWVVDSIPGAATMDLRSIHARSDRVAHVAATAGRIWRTTDGGRTWSLRYQSTDTTMFLDAMAFNSDASGFTLGDPAGGRFVLLITHDGGESWLEAPAAVRPPAVEGEAAFAASGTSLVLRSQFAWVGTGGTESHVLRWDGAAWKAVPSAIPGGRSSAGVFSVAFADELHGVVVGGDYQRPDSSSGTSAFTADGGMTWQPATRFPRGYRSGVAVRRLNKDDVMAIAVGTSGSDISLDGGRTWSPLDGTAFNAIQFSPSGVAYAVGARGRIAKLVIR